MVEYTKLCAYYWECSHIIQAHVVGQAGEYLAAAALQQHFRAIAFPGLPSAYDLVVESHAGKFLRCQVKTCGTQAKQGGSTYWRFNTGKRLNPYLKSDVDFFALVILPLRMCIFLDVSDITGPTYRIPTNKLDLDIENKSLNKVLGNYINEWF